MTSKQDNPGALTFGLDIGIASVGWAVLSESRIIDLGVRCFDKAETAKEGESLNLTRRTARLLRRRLRRRAWRLTKLARLLKREGLIAVANLFKLKIEKNTSVLKSAWQLRVDALDRQLNAEEWARVIYHLCKHRGFHWISRAEEKAAEGDSKSEGGKVKQGLAGTKKLMQEKNYRTAAEMVLAEFPEAQRNKQGDYSKALSRILLGDELKAQFEHQRKLGNTFATEKLEAAILGNGDRKSGLFWMQNPALAGSDLLRMLGHCTFEKTEYRAPKASFTAERHVWLTRLNNLRILVDGTTRSLNEAERRVALSLPYQQAGDLTYKQLRAALIKAGYLPESFRYTGLSYASGQKADEKIKDPETAALVKISAWQELRKTLKDASLEDEWQKISTDALEGRPQLLDQIAWVLSVYKDDTEVETELRKLSLPNAERMVDALLDIRFDKFSNLSLKALNQIVPLMEQGQRYDEAVANIQEYGHHSQLHKVGAGEHKYLPPFYKGRDKTGRMVFCDDMDIPRNPVVLRALNQARKVVNALIKEYGSPYEVHIEMARDLSRPFDERKKVKTAQEEFRDRNEKDKVLFAQDFNIVGAVKGKDFEKYQLYREQQGKCAYSIEPVDIHRLFEQGYVEIDHALPYSRSFDDSKNNRVLVLAKENRDKGNRTAYEYLSLFPGGENGERWRQFVAFVEGNKAYRLAKRSRLLRKDFGDKEAKEFRERNLNDTRYICKFFKNYVEQYLQLHEDSETKRCVVLSGQMTSFLRVRWGLIKVRGDSDRHHALDAVVVAACSHGMVKHLSDYSRRKELEQVRAGFVDVDTGEIINPNMFDQIKKHFPNPWPHFRDELEARLKLDDLDRLREEMQRFGTYSEDALRSLRPLFVSRAPQRRNSGAAHKDTIYAQPESLEAQGGVTQKVPLSSLTLKDLDKLIDPHRNEKLYAAIRARLEQHGGKGDKAFPSNNPLRKPDSDCNPTGPIVRGVTMVIDKLSGIPIRGGIAKNDSMVRVDVFTKANKFHLVPVYVHHTVAKVLPNRVIVAHKDEDEWPLLDDSFSFCFSIYPNDLIRVAQKQCQFVGYYAGCDRGSGNVNLWTHDRNQQVGKDGLIRGIGVKTALNVEKFNVDVLGNIYPAPPEKRRDLA
ncbi:type II CRISPR RNA-guided endonuclease Cas9 [Nitrosospira sp. Nsp1]|uniref:type II CRISPR RNA-guided endonuclease Cas9 n=1 Tax=Nitrosospira sp. Nsp1 TaxID=136547 RepID=UPI000B858DB1|nr:type II CRISPR RNA-guided endonuclease Cas9 [Nitrosospira sp. Nsp1]